MKNTIFPSCLSYTASTWLMSSGRLNHSREIRAGYPAYSPFRPSLHVYFPLKKNVSFRMIDTASKDVLQKSGFSLTTTVTSGRLGGIVLMVVDDGEIVVVVVVVLVGLVTGVIAVVVLPGMMFGSSGLCGVGLYTGMSPQILSFFAPIQYKRENS